MLETVTKFESVQFIMMAGLVVIIIFAMAARKWRQSELLASDDARQKDLIPISQRIANHKEREKKAGHQLARDYE